MFDGPRANADHLLRPNSKDNLDNLFDDDHATKQQSLPGDLSPSRLLEEPSQEQFTAFYIAAQMGADALELDVSDTSDRVPVLMHGADVSRTTTYQGSSGNVEAADPTFAAYINDSHTLHVETNEKYLNDTMTPYRNYLSIAGRAIGIPTATAAVSTSPCPMLEVSQACGAGGR